MEMSKPVLIRTKTVFEKEFNKGGRVVAVSTLTPGVENSKILDITDETATALKKIDQKRKLLNAIHKLDIAENYEALTDPIGKYIVNNREKIINKERTRRAQNNSKYNDEQNQRNQSLSNSPVSNQNNQIDQILDKEMYNDPENLEGRQIFCVDVLSFYQLKQLLFLF